MNTKWEYRKLGEICTIERGGSPRPIDKFITEDESGINWIKIGDTSESMYITHTAQRIIPEGVKKSRYVQAGDFLLSNSMSFGRPYILKIDGCIHDGWLVIHDNEGLFDKRFLYYYLSSASTYQKFKSMAVGGVVNNLNSEMVRKVFVPVPDLDEQITVANLLDKIVLVKAARQKQLDALDELVKARFIEMFRDSRFPQTTIRNVVDTNIMSVKKVFQPTDIIRYIDISSIDNKNNVTTGWSEFVLKEAPSRAQQHIQKNDILISTVRPNLRNVAINDYDYPNVVASSGFCVLRATKCSPLFLKAIVCSDSFTDEMTRVVTGANYPAIKDDDVLSYSIPLPPKTIQEQFDFLSQQVEQLKTKIRESLAETETLFQSLMQEYFG